MPGPSLEQLPVASPKANRGPLRLGYKPYLDGLRAFAVLVVMAHHAYLPLFHGGFLGVDIFFVLSGFLITSLLLEESRATGDISLKNFYMRRILRLIPALVLLLLFVQAYNLAFVRGPRFWIAEKEIASVVFYVSNWVQAFGFQMPVLSHSWSLSIEEQFYTVWPVAFWLLLRAGLEERWLVRLLLVACVLIATRRAVMWTSHASDNRIYFGSDMRFDELLTGCALGIWIHAEDFPWDRARSALRYLFAPATLVILALLVHPLHNGLRFRVGLPVVELAVCTVILGLVAGAGGLLQRFLEFAPVVWVGKLSYGLYLWHYPILLKAKSWHFLGSFGWVAGFALTFIAAALSYYFVELRFLRRRKEFAPRRCPRISNRSIR